MLVSEMLRSNMHSNLSSLAEGYVKICRPRAKHYVTEGLHDAARGQSTALGPFWRPLGGNFS